MKCTYPFVLILVICAWIGSVAAAEPAPLGTVWKGTLKNQNGEKDDVEMRVSERDVEKKTLTVVLTEKKGADWEFDGQFQNAKTFKITSVRRIQANQGVVNPPPVAGVTGTGTVTPKQLGMKYVWKEAKLNITITADLVDP